MDKPLKLSGILLPEPLPGESPISLAVRLFSQTGAVSTEKFMKTMLGRNIKDFANINISGCFSDPERAFRMSVFPYYMSVIPKDGQAAYLDKVIRLGQSGLVAKSGNFNSPWLKSCPLCAAQDILEHGTPYFHSIHEFVGLDICPVHGCRLVEHKSHSFGEISRFETGGPIMAPEAEQALAGLVTEMPGLDAERLDGFVLEALKAEGYLTDTRADLQSLYKDYEDFYGAGFLERYRIDPAVFRQQLVRIRSGKLYSNPFFILTIINMLGADMEEVRDWTPRSLFTTPGEDAPRMDCPNAFCGEKDLAPICCDSHGKYTYRCGCCNTVFTPSKTLQYGKSFRDSLMEFRKDHTWKETERKTGICRQTLHKIVTGKTDAEKIDRKVRAARRTALRCPTLTVLSFRHYKAYYTLQHFDKEWLDSHFVPDSTRRETSRRRMAEEDTRLFEELKALESSSAVHDGVLTWNYFCQIIGMKNSRNLKKNYPKCWNYIKDHTETPFESYMRRGRLYLDSVESPLNVGPAEFIENLSSTDDCRRAYDFLMEEYMKRA